MKYLEWRSRGKWEWSTHFLRAFATTRGVGYVLIQKKGTNSTGRYSMGWFKQHAVDSTRILGAARDQTNRYAGLKCCSSDENFSSTSQETAGVLDLVDFGGTCFAWDRLNNAVHLWHLHQIIDPILFSWRFNSNLVPIRSKRKIDRRYTNEG